MRNFLQNLNVWGAVLVSRGGDILHYTIPCLLQYCDKILLMQDNVDEKTKQIVEQYKAKYPNIIRLAETGFPNATPAQETAERGLHRRFKCLQGHIREKVFEYLREVHKTEKIDLLIFPDEDEIFSNYMPKLLEDFWAMPDKRAISMKPVEVYCDLMTITGRSMTGHVRVMKFAPDLTALPYRTMCLYRPLTKKDRIGNKWTTIHLAFLLKERLDWRSKHWTVYITSQEPLWRTGKDIREMSYAEIQEVLARKSDLTVEEYLRGGDKRVPMGIENAAKALREFTDILNTLQVRYFLGFGTCLHLFRDGELDRLDWDIDLICLGEDNEKLETGVSKILEAGFFDYKRKQDMPKWKKADGTVSEEKYVRTYSFRKFGCRVDIDPAYLSVDGEERVILKGRKRQFMAAVHPKMYFEGVNTILYRDKKYLVPFPVEDYLYSNYGDSWKQKIYGPMPWHRRPCRRDEYFCA